MACLAGLRGGRALPSPWLGLGDPPARRCSKPRRSSAGTRAAVPRWEAGHRTARHPLETRALPRPPWPLHASRPQPSAHVSRRGHAAVAALAPGAQHQQCPGRHERMPQGRPQGPARAARGDVGGAGVGQEVAQAALSAPGRPWARASLRPWVSWAPQGAHPRGARRQTTRQRAGAAGGAACDQHALPPRRTPHVLAEWPTWATAQGKALPRPAAAVEGRHGALAP